MYDILAVFNNGMGFHWWERKIGPAQASLVSSILYLQCDPDWGALSCSASIPSGTSLGVLVRASDNYADMGSWSDTLASPCSLEGILSDNCSYLQYMVILETIDIKAPPELYSITFDYNSVAIGDGYALMAPSIALQGVFPNPAHEVASVHFSLLEPASVTVRVFDVAGRLMAETSASEAETSSGANSISLDDLAPGVYFCVMSTEGFEAARRFVVVE
jgi:hypothetical protein